MSTILQEPEISFSPKFALQVARKIALCDSAFTGVKFFGLVIVLCTFRADMKGKKWG